MGKFTQLNSFVAVVEQGGFAAAARKLNRSRAQVNKSVIDLENELGVKLLNRTTRQVSTTPSGDDYYANAKNILSEIEEADRLIKEHDDEPRGKLKLNAPLSFGSLHLASAIADFMCIYPKVKVELLLDDRYIDPIAEGFDATLRIGKVDHQSSLIEHPITCFKTYLVSSPEFKKKHGTLENIEQLSDIPTIHYSNFGPPIWKFRDKEKTRKIKVNPMLIANNGVAIMAASQAGVGVAYLPSFIVSDALRDGSLVKFMDISNVADIEMSLLYAPSPHIPAKLSRLIDFLYDRFGHDDLRH